MNPLPSLILEGHHVRLEPLSLEHVPALVLAASESRATYTFMSVPSDPDAMRAWVGTALALREQGSALPFVTLDRRTGRVVGTTRFLALERWVWPHPAPPPFPTVDFEVAEIGGTWLAASAQRTPINTEAKLLMLEQAFEAWRVRRVSLKTDALNARSRAAIERLGCRFDGVLRRHSPSFHEGVRDTAFFSMLPSEWPAARDALRARLGRG